MRAIDPRIARQGGAARYSWVMPIRRHARALAILLLVTLSAMPGGARAQITLDPEAVLALADAPWQDRRGFVAALDTALQGVELDMPRLGAGLRAEDPFLWSVTGRFGAPLPGSRRAGGIVICARYGLATRDRMLERSLTEPAAFALFGATLAAHDDAAVWPEAGVARLACMISWDDPRRVAILSEAEAETALARRFQTVERPGGSAAPPAFSLAGRSGPRDTVVSVESARIERGPSHQVIRFRAFLLNGGM